jgi:flagellar biosynthetic protein FlhB
MAEQQDNDQKTEQPTAARLARAREQGQVPVSRELNHWFLIGGGALILLGIAPHMARSLVNILRNFIAQPEQVPDNAGALEDVFTDTIMHVGLVVALPLILLLVAAMAGPLLQTGFLLSADPLMPKWSKISPMAGFHRIFSKRALIEFLKNLAKLALIATVAFNLVRPNLPTIEHLIEMQPIQIVAEVRQLVLRLCLGILSVLTVIMLVDVIYQRLSFVARMRMTRQEVKEELRQSEGDPLIRQRLRQIRVQRARTRMMANVPKADVIITNPTHFAVALQYDPLKMGAPKCVAKGQDLIALKIREIADENKVTIVENPPLARALYPMVEVDKEIPPEHYKAVAEVISYVFRLRGRGVKT